MLWLVSYYHIMTDEKTSEDKGEKHEFELSLKEAVREALDKNSEDLQAGGRK